MSKTPPAGKTSRWPVADVIVVLKACGADEACLRDESYLLEELRRIDAQVMDEWVKILGIFRSRPRECATPKIAPWSNARPRPRL